MDSSRRNYVRFVGGFLILLFVGMLVFTIYRMQSLSHQAEDAERLVQTIDRVNAELKQRQAQDTYGGKTPQETLQLYIDAVEKGDYELASKYFVVEKQQKQLDNLNKGKREDLMNLLDVLKKVQLVDEEKVLRTDYQNAKEKYPELIYNQTEDEYVRDGLARNAKSAEMMTKVNGYNFIVNFALYPNGNWKISEI